MNNNINNIIVCIDVSGDDYDLSSLKIYHIYTICYQVSSFDKIKKYYKLNDVSGFHEQKRFISLKEYRKFKIKKLGNV